MKDLTYLYHYGTGSLPQHDFKKCRGELLVRWRRGMRGRYSDLKSDHGVEDARNFHQGHGGTEER
jgi:hypothetical protein